jgi:glycosyltransferase involved in cell wall biosynthesis
MSILDKWFRKRETQQRNDPTLPLVSILIRSMDRPTLQRAIRSATQQTWGNIEVVVVAACGARHRDVAEQQNGRPVRLIRPQPDATLSRAAAANLALDSARGEWVNFLDDDDQFDEAHVATLMTAARPRNERVVFSVARVTDERGKPIGQTSFAGNHVQLYFHSRASTCAIMFQRSLLDDGARFDPQFDVHEDHDFQIACATRTPFAFVDAITCTWNAQIGESGCGFGANDENPRRVDAVEKLREKWKPVFDRWLRQFDDVLFAGKTYLDANDLPAALGCLNQALSLRPNDVNALNLCGMAHFRAGNLAEAERLVMRAVKRLPKQTQLRDNLARIRARRAETAGG